MRKVFLLLKGRRGTTAIEYSLIAGGIAVAIATAVFTVGTNLMVLFNTVGTMAVGFISGG